MNVRKAGSVLVPVRKMMKKVVERENAQFFFQQLASLGTDTFQIFNWLLQYILWRNYNLFVQI